VSEPVQPTALDRLLTALRLLIRAELPQLTYFGTYEFSIQSSSGSTVDIAPVDTTVSLPSMTAVPLISSLQGQAVVPNSGLCRVRFINGDPSQPIVVGIVNTASSVSIPATGQLNIGPSASKITFANGTQGIARVGDMITLYIPPGCYVSGMITPPAGPPIPIVSISIVNGFSALISTGSPNVVTK
jgi:hypothetical protein